MIDVKRRTHSLQWRHNGHNSVSNYQPHDCLLTRLFRHRSQKTSKLRVGRCAGNSPVTGEFPAQMASNAENVSIWWRHHVITNQEVVDVPTTLEHDLFNSSTPSARYLQWWTGSALVQAIACRLSGAKPFPELMLPFCHLDPWEQTSVKFESKWKTFHSWKCLRSCRLWNGGYFVQGEMKFNARKTISVLRYMTYETLLPKLSQHSGCWWLGALID